MKRTQFGPRGRKFKHILFAIALAVTACAPMGAIQSKQNAPVEKKVVDPDDQQAMNDILIEEGESLIAAETLETAVGKFREVLTTDPQNERAGFWIAFLGPILESKGFLGRMRPMYRAIPNGAERHATFIKRWTSDMSPEWKQFYTQGRADIETMDQFQEFVDRVSLRLTDARVWLRENRGSDLVVRWPRGLLYGLLTSGEPGKIEKRKRACSPIAYGPISFLSPNCDPEPYREMRLNRADFDAITLSLAYLETHLAILNAYRIDPALTSLALQNKTDNEGAVVKQILLSGRPVPLRQSQRLKELKSLGGDLLVAYKYLTENKDILCPPNSHSAELKGHLLSSGICLLDGSKEKQEKIAIRTVQMIENLALGGNVDVTDPLSEGDHGDKILVVNLNSYLTTPVRDLVSVAPSRFDDCGRWIDINDQALIPFVASGNIRQSLKEASDRNGCASLGERK